MSLSAILYPIEWVVAWILVTWHSLFTWLGMSPSGGWTWVLSIVGLVVVIRSVMIPIFVRQIRSSRRLQEIQPELKKIQTKYKGKTDTESRQAQQREISELMRTRGANPLASCLPILLQMPIFFALFRVLDGIKNEGFSIGPFTNELVQQAASSEIFGAQLTDTFLRAETWETRVIALILVVLMAASQFWSQRQVFMKNMSPAALQGQFAQQQKILLYVLPPVFALSGLGFPLGVVIYWFVTNVFSVTQQHFVIRNMPSPGTPAEKALRERQARKAAAKQERAVARGASPAPVIAAENANASAGTPQGAASLVKSATKGARPAAAVAPAGSSPAGSRPPSGQRQQPKRNNKSRKRRR